MRTSVEIEESIERYQRKLEKSTDRLEIRKYRSLIKSEVAILRDRRIARRYHVKDCNCQGTND